MRRGEPQFGNDEGQSSPKRQFSTAFHHSHSGYSLPRMHQEQSRIISYSSKTPPTTNSPQPPSFGSILTNTDSFTPTPQPTRPAILSTPSINYPTPTPSLLPLSSPHPSSITTNTHIQDLQIKLHHQTTTLQSLQSEHTNLLQALTHHRNQIATLEQTLNLSTAEVSILCEEKERLQAQIPLLETQIKELQQTRDETRKQLSENGNQYMRIMEMASRLQERGVQERKEWTEERGKLLARIGVLEEAMITSTGTDGASVFMGGGSGANTAAVSSPPRDSGEGSSVSTFTATNTDSISPEMLNVLRNEISRLRARNQMLEEGMRTMVEENKGVRRAAEKVVEGSMAVERRGRSILGE